VTRIQAHALLSQLASTAEAGDLTRPRAVLLLWFLRNVVGIDDLDAYEYVCDGPLDEGIDGLYLEGPTADDDTETVVLLQSKYPESPANVGVTDIRGFIGAVTPFGHANSLAALLSENIDPQLKNLIERHDLVGKLQAGKLRVRLVFLTAGVLTDPAKRLVDAANNENGNGYLTVYDIDRLGPICKALNEPTSVQAIVTIECDQSQRFSVSAGGNDIMAAAVKASDIVTWPGIDDRSLFDLNVRRELRPNRVRTELYRAINRERDHPNFLAFHNGLTVVCDSFNVTDGQVTITNLSVVNGAQSAVAFYSNKEELTGDLRVVVKFVGCGTLSQISREVGRRSNMQNPVNPRNLRARDGRQLVLEQAFRDNYPDITYETRPDYSNPPATARVIQNDAAAQLLCAFYNERPWLAVKKLSLFESDVYPEIFPPAITAHHIVFVDYVKQRVDAAKTRFADDYRRSWILVSLIAVYLVGQLLRADEALRDLVADPYVTLADSDLETTIDTVVRHVAGALAVWHDEREREEGFDNFKVDFKNEERLRALAGAARSHYLYATRVQT
jgi:AIPR protein